MSLPLEKATYRAKAVNACFGITPDKGTNYVAIGFEIVDHEHFAGERTRVWQGYFSGKATARTIEALQYMGFASDDLSLLEDCDEARCAELLPSVVEIVVEPEEYNSEWNLRVQWVNRPGAGKFTPVKPLQGSELKTFAAQMKVAMKSARGAAPKSAQPSNGAGGSKPQEPHPNAPGAQDDIPFATADIGDEPSPIARHLR